MPATRAIDTRIIFFCTAMITALSDTGCTSIINDDTCIINRTSEWDLQVGNIVCNDSFPICIVLCQDVLSCSDNVLGNRLSIVCPYNGERCIITCASSRSCRTTQIYSSNSKYTEINIKANNAGRDMHIYASHELHINVIGPDADFLESIIYSLSLSTIIDINCDNGEMCTDNTINARKTAQSLTLSCNGLHSDCSNSNIWCPITESTCNINCTTCSNMNVYTSKGSSNIHWHCDNKNSCTDSKLICDKKQDNFVWNDGNQRWELDQTNCDQLYISTVNITKPNTEPEEHRTNQSQKIMINTYNTSFMYAVAERDRSFIEENRLYITVIAGSCTIAIVSIFWFVFECIRKRCISKEGEIQSDQNSTVGAPPPRNKRTSSALRRNGEICVIRVQSNICESVYLGNQELRYEYGRNENVFNTEFMNLDVDVDDIDDSILCVEPEGVPSGEIVEVDDLKCADADVDPTPGN